MPTVQELQQTVDAAFPQAAKVIRPDGSVFITPYLIVTSPTSLTWTPYQGGVPWNDIDVDLSDVDWEAPTIDLGNGYKLNHNFDFSAHPEMALAVNAERKLVKTHWADWIRASHEAELAAA